MSTARESEARTARVHVVISDQLDGHCLIHPVTAPGLAAYGRPEDALAEMGLFLREHFAHAPPAALSRLSLPDGARLVEIGAALPRDEEKRRREGDEPAVTFAVVVVPSGDRGDAWALVPALDHAFFVEKGEDFEEAVRAEIQRLVGALDLSVWEQVGLLPPRAVRIEEVIVPLPEGARGADEEARHARLAVKVRRRQARSALREVASELGAVVRRAPHPPIAGRDVEMGSLRALLDGKERLGVLLVGPEHAGKTALVRAYAAEAERPVFSTSGAQLIAGMSGLGQWQERVRAVMDAVAELDGVLFFESLDDLLAERVESGGVDFAGAMRPWLDEGKVRIVAEIRSDRLDAVEGRHWAFFAGLSRLRVEPLSAEATRAALEQRIAFDTRVAPDRPRVAGDAVAPLVDLAERYLPYGAFPGKAVRLYDDLRAAHEQDGATSGAPRILGRADLYRVFSIATGVPELLLRDDAPLRVEDVAAALGAQVIGQEDAVRRLAETIGVVKAGLAPSGKPLSTFLFIGPTGVGKTELARALAAYLFGSADRMVRFDMSEFMTPDAAERLIRGTDSADGLLTRRVREQPFCVLLLDEIEKAHPAVFDLLLQVTGEGRLTDARGQTAYFHNAILIMTSNLGAAERRTPAGFAAAAGASDAAHYQRIVASSFRQEFVGRIDRVIPFRALTREEVRRVAKIGVDRLARRRGIAESGSALSVSEAALAKLADEGFSEAFGARAQRRHLDEHLAAPLSRILSQLGGGAKDLILEVTAAGEPPVETAGVPAAEVDHGGIVLRARRLRSAEKAEHAFDHDRIAALRREIDELMDLDTVEELSDHLEFLVTQLNLSDEEKRDGRVLREQAELSAEHHRLADLWKKLMGPREELHALEELSIVATLEGQPVEDLVPDAQRAAAAFRRALPYALVAQEPRRDAVTLMIEEIDEGALSPWFDPLLRSIQKRGWSALAHVQGGARRPGEEWPADRPWGPPRTMDEMRDAVALAAGAGSRTTLILRVKGPYAGALLALEAGLHRTVPARRAEKKPGEDSNLHVGVRVIALQFDVPAEAWTGDALRPPPPAGVAARRRGPAARLWDEVNGHVEIARRTKVEIDPAVYWDNLEAVALAHLLLIEKGELDRDAYFAPALEASS